MGPEQKEPLLRGQRELFEGHQLTALTGLLPERFIIYGQLRGWATAWMNLIEPYKQSLGKLKT